jgi:hypothetical protein
MCVLSLSLFALIQDFLVFDVMAKDISNISPTLSLLSHFISISISSLTAIIQ